MRRGDWAAFNDGINMGRQMYADYDAAKTREGLADAAQANQVTEGAVGEEVGQEKIDAVQKAKDDAYNRARDEALDKNRNSKGEQIDPEEAGLAAAKQYDPAIEELKRRQGMDSPDVRVMRKGTDTGKAYSTRVEAQAAASADNQRGMADVYRQRGKPEAAERLTQTAMQTEAAGLGLKQAKRADAVGEKRQGLEIGNVENQYKLQEQEFNNRAAASKLQGIALVKAQAGEFAQTAKTNPALADYAIKHSGFLGSLGATDAEYVKGSRDDLDITMKDGKKLRVSLTNLDEWSRGKADLKTVSLAEGGKVLVFDSKGKVVGEHANPKAPDGSKNDAAMDDAASVMDRVLDANKTQMSQFGGRETEVRQSAVLEHNKGIGEFRRTAGRSPTREEAAIIAEGALARAAAKASKK